MLAAEITREEAASWAISLTEKDDSRDLEYFPAANEEDIWDALEFLSGVDAKDSPDSYYFILIDIESYYTNWLHVVEGKSSL